MREEERKEGGKEIKRELNSLDVPFRSFVLLSGPSSLGVEFLSGRVQISEEGLRYFLPSWVSFLFRPRLASLSLFGSFVPSSPPPSFSLPAGVSAPQKQVFKSSDRLKKELLDLLVLLSIGKLSDEGSG